MICLCDGHFQYVPSLPVRSTLRHDTRVHNQSSPLLLGPVLHFTHSSTSLNLFKRPMKLLCLIVLCDVIISWMTVSSTRLKPPVNMHPSWVCDTVKLTRAEPLSHCYVFTADTNYTYCCRSKLLIATQFSKFLYIISANMLILRYTGLIFRQKFTAPDMASR